MSGFGEREAGQRPGGAAGGSCGPGLRPTSRVARAALGAVALFSAAVVAAPVAAAGRVLTPMDVVTIKIVDVPDLNTTTRVETDGTIDFPYLGRIMVAGLTEDQLARLIERRLVERKILADP